MISKTKLGEFNSLSIFNEDYLLVERKGLYNLIDNEGKYVSHCWFKEIKKNNGGGADFVEVNDKRVQLRSIPSIVTYGKIRSALNDTTILSRIDTRCITVVAPYKVYSINTSRNVTIIATVSIWGKELMLGKNGKLYEDCIEYGVKEYILPKFFISETDINRLIKVADDFNWNYDVNYDMNNKPSSTSSCALKEAHTICWMFGFNDKGDKEFNTATSPIIHKLAINAWGGDTIKVRFNTALMPQLYHDKFVEDLNMLEFGEWTKNGREWWTKEYTLSELAILFDDMKELSKKTNYI